MKLLKGIPHWPGVILVFLAAGCVPGRESIPVEGLKKEVGQFAQVDKGLYRGAQPTEEGLRLLKKFGIKTVVSFRHEEKEIEWERQKAEALGLRFVSLPWRIQFRPETDVMKNFLALVGKKRDGPFFFHCRRGAERTGVADAVYRRHYQNLSKEEAWRRATKGFRIRFYWRPFMKFRYREFVKEE